MIGQILTAFDIKSSNWAGRRKKPFYHSFLLQFGDSFWVKMTDFHWLDSIRSRKGTLTLLSLSLHLQTHYHSYLCCVENYPKYIAA